MFNVAQININWWSVNAVWVCHSTFHGVSAVFRVFQVHGVSIAVHPDLKILRWGLGATKAYFLNFSNLIYSIKITFICSIKHHFECLMLLGSVPRQFNAPSQWFSLFAVRYSHACKLNPYFNMILHYRFVIPWILFNPFYSNHFSAPGSVMNDGWIK